VTELTFKSDQDYMRKQSVCTKRQTEFWTDYIQRILHHFPIYFPVPSSVGRASPLPLYNVICLDREMYYK